MQTAYIKLEREKKNCKTTTALPMLQVSLEHIFELMLLTEDQEEEKVVSAG